MTEKYVNNEKNIQILWLKTSIFQIFRKIVKLEQLTLFYNIFQVFNEENCANKNIDQTLTLFSKKGEEGAAGYCKTTCKFY